MSLRWTKSEEGGRKGPTTFEYKNVLQSVLSAWIILFAIILYIGIIVTRAKGVRLPGRIWDKHEVCAGFAAKKERFTLEGCKSQRHRWAAALNNLALQGSQEYRLYKEKSVVMETKGSRGLGAADWMTGRITELLSGIGLVPTCLVPWPVELFCLHGCGAEIHLRLRCCP